MAKRTSPKDGRKAVEAGDLEDLVHDKREGWRATGAKRRRRQRRYTKLLISQISLHSNDDADALD